MDNLGNLNIAELMPLIAKLGENPAALSALSGLMGSMGGASVKREAPPPRATDTQGADALSAIMGLLGGSAPQKKDGGEKAGVSVNASRVFGTQEEIKNRILLLSAVRPYLSEERRQRLETVIRLLRLAELGSLGSLLDGK